MARTLRIFRGGRPVGRGAAGPPWGAAEPREPARAAGATRPRRPAEPRNLTRSRRPRDSGWLLVGLFMVGVICVKCIGRGAARRAGGGQLVVFGGGVDVAHF